MLTWLVIKFGIRRKIQLFTFVRKIIIFMRPMCLVGRYGLDDEFDLEAARDDETKRPSKAVPV